MTSPHSRTTCLVCGGTGSKLDPLSGILQACPACSAEVSSELGENPSTPMWKRLGFPQNLYLTSDVNFRLIISDAEAVKHVSSSIEDLKRVVASLVKTLKSHSTFNHGFVLGLPASSTVENLIYPLMVTALEGVWDVPPLATATEVRQVSRSNYQAAVERYSELRNAELVFVLAESGASNSSLESVKGLAQARGVFGDPTVVVTTLPAHNFDGLLTPKIDARVSSLVGYFVQPLVKESSVKVYEDSHYSSSFESIGLHNFKKVD